MAELVTKQQGMALAIQGYYDGTGSQANEHHGELIGLAGYAARLDVWGDFESTWWAVLADDSERPACRWLHMKDANVLRGEFSPDKGWTKGGVQKLVHALFNRCFSPRGHGRPIPEVLIGSACTLDMDAYERVCEQYPHFAAKTPEALCVDHVVGNAIRQLIPPEVEGMDLRDIVARRESIALFFDRNEPFRHQILRVWEALPWHRRPLSLKLISAIGETDKEASAALQAADFLAWHTNRHVAAESGDLFAQVMMFMASRCSALHYDYDELVKTAKRWREDGGYYAVDNAE